MLARERGRYKMSDLSCVECKDFKPTTNIEDDLINAIDKFWRKVALDRRSDQTLNRRR
jgi:hypothetical protein